MAEILSSSVNKYQIGRVSGEAGSCGKIESDGRYAELENVSFNEAGNIQASQVAQWV